MWSLRFAAVIAACMTVFVAADDGQPAFAPPELLTAGDGDTAELVPYFGGLLPTDDNVDDNVIRGLLRRSMKKRQSCPAGYGLCSDGGCCPGSYYCDEVDGQKGCCPNGKICTSGGGGCPTAGYVPCAGDDFCCPAGYECYRDSANNPQCSLYGSNTDTFTYTYTNTYYSDTSYPTNTPSTSTPTANGGGPNTATYNTGGGSGGGSGPTHVGGPSTSSTSSSSRSSSSTSGLDPTGLSSSNTSGAEDWKRTWRILGAIPVFGLIVFAL